MHLMLSYTVLKRLKITLKREKSTSSIALLKLDNYVKFTILAGKKFQHNNRPTLCKKGFSDTFLIVIFIQFIHVASG